MELFQEPAPSENGRPTWKEWRNYKEEMIQKLGYEKKIAIAKKNPKTSAQILAERSSKKEQGWDGWERLITPAADGKSFNAVDLIREDREETWDIYVGYW